jgi:hypothetical protein
VLVSICSSAAAAHADEPSSVATDLFAKGTELLKAGSTDQACEMFSASYAADPKATGSLLNLALCNEKRGHNASAWSEFRQVAADSAGRREDRVTLAHEHEAKLLPLLSYLTVSVPNGARAPTLRIVLDEKRPLAEPTWNSKLPLDPGMHTLRVEADGRQSRSYKVQLADTSDDKTITVEPLALMPQPTTTPTGVAHEQDKGASRRTLGYVIGGVGVAALGAGSVFGVMALVKNKDITNDCAGDHCPSAVYGSASHTNDVVHTDALVADICFGVGAAAVIAGAVLVWTGRKEPQTSPRTSTLRIDAAPTRGGGTFVLGGSF